MDEIKSGSKTLAVALLNMAQDRDKSLDVAMEELFVQAQFKINAGDKILVKPNLLKAKALACTDPQFVATCCQKLLDLGAKVIVADSPGFGTCEGVAQSIGLTATLAPLGLKVRPFTQMVWQKFDLDRVVRVPMAKEALEADLIFSLPRVKAHSQMGLTMAVKNCFGVVGGAHKAVAHTLFGSKAALFSDVLVAIWSRLPKVWAVADGRICMHVTGPTNGRPYPLNLLGACTNAAILDMVIAQILQVDFKDLPLGQALARYGLSLNDPYEVSYPMDSPKSFSSTGFIVPKVLLTTSFAPHRLILSCLRRLWTALFNHA